MRKTPSARGRRAALLPLLLLLLLPGAGCGSGERGAERAEKAVEGAVDERTLIRPGAPLPLVQVSNPYQGDRQAIDDGRRLFAWFNCSGCHSPGGGGAIGPPLYDDEWIYGGDAYSIYESIVEGRPDGMPTWGGKIPEEQVWKLVAYIQSMREPTEKARKLMPIDNDPALDEWVRRRQ